MSTPIRRILIEFDNAPTGTDELALMKYLEAEAKVNAYIAANYISKDIVMAHLAKTDAILDGINTTEGSAL